MLHSGKQHVKHRKMASLREQYLKIIRRWQLGEKTPELAKEFQDLHARLLHTPDCVFDDDVNETVHEINNYIHIQALLKSTLRKT